jgi:hypothetical protein
LHDSDIIINEEEPSSIIAFVLGSKHYDDEIRRSRQHQFSFGKFFDSPNVTKSDLVPKNGGADAVSSLSSPSKPEDGKRRTLDYSDLVQEMETVDLNLDKKFSAEVLKPALLDRVEAIQSVRSSIINGLNLTGSALETEPVEQLLSQKPTRPTSSSSQSIRMNFGQDSIEEMLLKAAGTHIKYRKSKRTSIYLKNIEFSAGPTKCFCRVYFAEQFDALRRNCGCEETFVQSLARCHRWNAKGGQSGSSFFKTKDDRYMMKQMSKPEMEAFLRFAPAYFEYMSQAFFHELPTVLAKIFGVYRIGYKNTQTNKSMKIDVLVMENLFYDRRISRIFDLKGSMRNRHVQSTGRKNEVLLDQNLMEGETIFCPFHFDSTV